MKYGSHINIEYCHTVTAVKYLFKYTYKGEDRIIVENEYDEINKFSIQRYISSCQAAWRLFGFPLAAIYPSVLFQTVHLPGQQNVTYDPSSSKKVRKKLNTHGKTMLTCAFELWKRDEEARNYKYEELPRYYRWVAKKKEWRKRVNKQKSDQIGRMASLHPSSEDVFFMRLLLKNRKGPKSFEDLRTVDGIVHETYRAACIALELCKDDSHWVATLNEAVGVAMPRRIRDLFCCILREGHPTDPLKLYEHFREAMSEDFVRQRKEISPNIQDDVLAKLTENDLLLYLNKRFAYFGKENSKYCIPNPDEDLIHTGELDDQDIDVDKAREFYDKNYSLLNEDQRIIFDEIRYCLDNEIGGVYSLDAPGGCGKTFTCNLLLAYVAMQNQTTLAMAMSGIAALLLDNGVTFHRGIGCPVPCGPDASSKYALKSAEAERIRQAKILVIDEVSLQHQNQFEMTDRFLRVLMNCDKFMGGKILLLMHDWRQQLPIIQNGSRGDIIDACIFNSLNWKSVKKFKLTQNMRVQRLINEKASPERIKKLEDHAK